MAIIKISAVIITYNEEKNIERCLSAIQYIADEIIVLDSFSTDKTEEICKKFNVNFYQQKFEGFGKQKNKANSLASNNYILSLDADEVLSPELKKSIIEIKNNCSYSAYSVKRLTNYCGQWIKYCGWYPDTKIRLFDKTRVNWDNENVHEKIVSETNLNPIVLNGDLLHYSFYSINQHIEQINKFSEIKANDLFKKGKKATILTLILKPIFKFIKSYFIKLGFLDGFYGYVICRNSAHAEFLKYAKLWSLYKLNKQK